MATGRKQRKESGAQRQAEPKPAPAEERIDEASAESFPASDPPSFSPSTVGPPAHAQAEAAEPPRRRRGSARTQKVAPPAARSRPRTTPTPRKAR